ncbi:MAG TPA: YbdK family carboxylate-amine ligase [Azospira sp.]|nr:YbdK family carboxylate-amine ligase [Azospira sp.]
MLEFKSVSPYTIGVELELQVINPHTQDLTRGAPDLLRALEKVAHPGEIKPEITESMIELNSSPHARHDSLLEELHAMRDAVVHTAGSLNLAIAGGGTHPFHRWHERRIFPTEHFQQLSSLYGYLAKQFTVFGQHIHVACESGDDAVYLTHQLSRYIPHFIALSAASPFSQGQDTSFETSRLHAVSAFPLSGHMPPVASWEAFEAYFGKMLGYGIIGSIKDFYWDIRPKPEYGTVEVRICDTPLDVDTAAALAAFVQALAFWLLVERPHPSHEVEEGLYLVYGYNRFQATRFGFEATLVDPRSQHSRTLRDDLLITLQHLRPYADVLGSRTPLARLEAMAGSGANGSAWLRARHEESGALEDVVRLSARCWAGQL